MHVQVGLPDAIDPSVHFLRCQKVAMPVVSMNAHNYMPLHE